MKPQYKTLHQIFSEVAAAPNKAAKVKILKEHNFLHVRDVLRGCYDNQIEWDLPEGTPPYEEDKNIVKEQSNGNLVRVTKQLKYFVLGGPGKNLSNIKKERMWVSVIESIHPDDVPIFTAMKDKTFNGMYKGLTKNLVKEVWPNLIRD